MFLHRTALLMIVGFYLLVPLLLDWWLQPAASWYRPFLIWLVLIGIAWLIDLQRGRRDA
ncbi:hypothetical protein [Marinobacterium aestuariivivens]|uniref:MFS transporter n=1 Tax=Marinobacterium aestuariivivens TaxID=1698799 RepID=A0ABW1ZZU6_9GAMM